LKFSKKKEKAIGSYDQIIEKPIEQDHYLPYFSIMLNYMSHYRSNSRKL